MQYQFRHITQLSTDDLIALYDRMVAERLARVVFYDRGVNDALDWVSYLTNTRSWLVRNEHPALGVTGIWWLNSFMGKSAMMHFCNFRVLDRAGCLDVGRQALTWLANENIFDSLYGITPCRYVHVFPLMTGLGFKLRGAVPSACNLKRGNRNNYVDGVISVLDLNTYKKEHDHV